MKTKFIPGVFRGPCLPPVFSGTTNLGGSVSGTSPNYAFTTSFKNTVNLNPGDTFIMEFTVAENFNSSTFVSASDIFGNSWNIGFQHGYATSAGGISNFGAFYGRVKNAIAAGTTISVTISFINNGVISGPGCHAVVGTVNLGKIVLASSGGFDNTGNSILGGSGSLSAYQIVFGFANFFNADMSATPVGMTPFPNMFFNGGTLDTVYAFTKINPLSWLNTWTHSGVQRNGAGFMVFNFCEGA